MLWFYWFMLFFSRSHRICYLQKINVSDTEKVKWKIVVFITMLNLDFLNVPCYAKVLLGSVDFATTHFTHFTAFHDFRWTSRVQASESTTSACRHSSCGSLRQPVSSMWMMIAGISSLCECLIQIRFSLYQHQVFLYLSHFFIIKECYRFRYWQHVKPPDDYHRK